MVCPRASFTFTFYITMLPLPVPKSSIYDAGFKCHCGDDVKKAFFGTTCANNSHIETVKYLTNKNYIILNIKD
jgi:hypothetical protein